jgi:hypothetical protein
MIGARKKNNRCEQWMRNKVSQTVKVKDVDVTKGMNEKN